MSEFTVRKPAVFLDRDGTLIPDAGYASHPSQIELFPETLHALQQLRLFGFRLIIVTNQSGIGRGYFTEEQYQAVERYLLTLLEPVGIEAVYHCPDAPSNAGPRRKPAPGMLFEAAAELSLDLGKSWMVGDQPGDLGCAQRAGVRPVLVRPGFEPPAGVPAFPDLDQAAHHILQNSHALSASP